MKYGKRLLPLPVFLIFFVILASCFMLLALAPSALAQTSNYDVTVSPVFFDLTANPDTNLNGIIKVRNNTSSPIPLKLEVKRLEGDLTGSISLKQAIDDATLLWIKFENNTVALKPLEWTEIPFSISVPKDAAYGYYFAISFTQASTDSLTKTGATIKGAAAVPILLNVTKAGAKFDGKLTSFTTDADFYEYLPTKFKINFQNTGNIHIRPKGNIFVKDWLGNQVATLPINEGQGAILPNASKMLETSWNEGFITIVPKLVNGTPKLDKNGKPQTELKIRFDKILDFRIGRYTAQAVVVLSTDTRDLTFDASTSFFAFPWKIVIGVTLIVLFAGIGFFNTIRNMVKRILGIFKRGKKENSE